jgi:hypothetical protein
VQGALLNGLVDPRDHRLILGRDGIGVAGSGRFLEAAELRLDRSGEPAVLVALPLGAENSLLL